MKKAILFSFILFGFISQAQIKDTLKVRISIKGKNTNDTVFYYSSRVDTVALQPVKTDTNKIVDSKHPQDLEESKYGIKILGNVRVNSFYDFKGMPDTEGFVPYDIPVGNVEIEGLSGVYIGARQSRIALEGIANTKVGRIRTYIETDFVSNQSSFIRLRHAFAEWSYFKIGYTWTTFMDVNSLPITVDFEGPNSALSLRHGLIMFEKKIPNVGEYGISLENPSTDYFNPADSISNDKNVQGNFDIAGRFQYKWNSGYVQIASIFRRINYIQFGKVNGLYGWGILVSSTININSKNKLQWQYSFGDGIAHYIVGFSGRGLDAIYNPNTKEMELMSVNGGFLTYSHHFSKTIWASATYGLSFLEIKDFQLGEEFASSTYGAINAFFEPISTIRLGLELTYGVRVNKNNEDGTNGRISTIFQFSF